MDSRDKSIIVVIIIAIWCVLTIISTGKRVYKPQFEKITKGVR